MAEILMASPAAKVQEGDILWEPSASFVAKSNLMRYQAWLEKRTGRKFHDYNDLWQWSIDDIPEFWSTIWDYFELGPPLPKSAVLPSATMPGTRWFEGADLNFAEHVFRGARDGPAIVAYAECRSPTEMSWSELEAQVGAVAASLRRMGIESGDRVVAYLPNVPETVVAFLASASIGAVWSCCAPDFGADSVLERFQQIQPKVLFAADGYRYGGKDFDRSDVVSALQTGLPSLTHTVLVPHLGDWEQHANDGTVSWNELVAQPAPLEYSRVPFMHPLWMLYTSGTTGRPKPIVHGHGGIVVEYLKNGVLANDRKTDDRVLWFTSTGWILWNMLVGNLLSGATVVLYDGSPTSPDAGVLWRLAALSRTTILGCSPAFLEFCMKSGYSPADDCDLGSLRGLSVSGAPLSPEAGRWVYDNLHSDLWLVTGSGGTDVASAFVGASPFMPMRAGQIPARLLGVDVQAFDQTGESVVDEVGELVITQPMPSMPLFIWGDTSGDRYRKTYFDRYPGVWRHGDWVTITAAGAAVIHGRSDATINRRGVRLGSGEIYRVVEALPEIADSLVVDLVLSDGSPYMPLFVVATSGEPLNKELRRKIARQIEEQISRRFVPDDVIQVPAVPRTLTGKKLEVPVKRILLGERPQDVVSLDATADPEALQHFIDLAGQGLPLVDSALSASDRGES
jgi:acetoacetyl-CoA synthetase